LIGALPGRPFSLAVRLALHTFVHGLIRSFERGFHPALEGWSVDGNLRC
jgi:hypothetical protein